MVLYLCKHYFNMLVDQWFLKLARILKVQDLVVLKVVLKVQDLATAVLQKYMTKFLGKKFFFVINRCTIVLPANFFRIST